MVLVATACSADITSFEQTDQTISAGLPRSETGRSTELLSALFGLDNTLPRTANRIFRGAAGLDGMPVIFSTKIDHETLQAGDFRVIRPSGATGSVHCVSLIPAKATGESRTALLVGEFGNAQDDPPVRVEIAGHLHALDRRLDFRGADIAVTPLAPGPKLILLEIVSEREAAVDFYGQRRNGTECLAAEALRAVRVVWTVGVTLADGCKPGEAERTLYRVEVEGSDGSRRVVHPIAINDLDDGDNKHLLCLGTSDRPVTVCFPAGELVDPNGDLNPPTEIAATQRP